MPAASPDVSAFATCGRLGGPGHLVDGHGRLPARVERPFVAARMAVRGQRRPDAGGCRAPSLTAGSIMLPDRRADQEQVEPVAHAEPIEARRDEPRGIAGVWPRHRHTGRRRRRRARGYGHHSSPPPPPASGSSRRCREGSPAGSGPVDGQARPRLPCPVCGQAGARQRSRPDSPSAGEITSSNSAAADRSAAAPVRSTPALRDFSS